MKIDKHDEFRFTIKGEPRTKKNSAVMCAKRATLLPSKFFREYEKLFRTELIAIRGKFGGKLPHFDGPVHLEAKYYLKDRAHYPDLNGLIQATQDIISDEYKLVTDKETGTRKRQRSQRWILADDRFVKSLDGCRIAGIDKENPRVEICIRSLDVDLEHETDKKIIELAKARMAVKLL